MSTEVTRARAGRPVTVIEIGGDWLKILHGSASQGGLSVDCLHLEKFDSATSLLSRSIADGLGPGSWGNAPVIGILPRQMVTVRILELPSTDPSEIVDMIDFQAAKQTPYSKEEIFTDYRILGGEREGYSRIMLAIVQRSVLRHRFHILEEADVDAERMSISSEGLLSWLRISCPMGEEGHPLAMVDVDSFYSDFLVVDAGRLLFSRSMLIGANDLLNDADPEKMRNRFVQESQRSVELYQAEAPGGKALEKIFLTGAGARIPALVGELGQGLGLPCETKDATEQLKKKGKVTLNEDQLRYASLTSLIGVGMAPDSLEINLIPDSVRLRKGLVTRSRSLSILGALVMATLVVASLFATVRFYLERSQMENLRIQIEKVNPVAQRAQKMFNVLEAVRDYQDSRFAAINILTALHSVIPAEVSVEAMDVDVERSTVSLSGSGASIRDVRSLVGNLEGSKLLRDVKEDGSTAKDSRTGRFRFKVAGFLERTQ